MRDETVPRFSLAERDRRWSNVRALMAREDIDALFVPPNTGMFDTFQANVRYLTGIGGNHAMAAAIFPREGDVTAVSSPDIDRSLWLDRQDWVSDVRGISSGWGYAGEAIARLKEIGGVRRLGVTGLCGNTRFPEGTTSHGIVERLRLDLPEVEIVNANLLMEQARFVRSEEEIAFLRTGVALVERSIDVIAAEARPGVPERVVYARMLASIVEGGGELPSMILWSAGNPQPPSNYYMPTGRPFEKGDIILTEAEARWGGYCAQNTQPLCLGKPDAELQSMFARQQEAIGLCYDMLRPGTTIGQISTAVNAMADDRYDCLILMHARGLGDDAPMAVYQPRDATMANWMLEANSTFIVKPVVHKRGTTKRIYWGDTVVCTDSGAERLGTRPPAIIEVG